MHSLHVLLRAFKFILSDLQTASYLDLMSYEGIGLVFTVLI